MKTCRIIILLGLALLLNGCASLRQAGESAVENMFRSEIPQESQRQAS